MEGEYHALIWGFMHVWQYLYWNDLTFYTEHKPLECLATMLDAYRKRRKWINMVHDFNFKIMHRARSKRTNVNALSKILVGYVNEDGNFEKEIQDCEWMQHVHKEEDTCWVGIRR
jgi:hypothetical protein